MGRVGKVQLRKIESTTSRQVSFCKRKKGLFKKAAELSVLCDAQVAVIIFSNNGKVYEYANTSMEKTLHKYTEMTAHKAQYDETVKDSEIAYWQRETRELWKETESLQNTIRHLKGEALTSLSSLDIQQLQNTLEKSLARVRSKKEERRIEMIAMLHKRELYLQLKNRFLMRAIERNQGNTSRVHLDNSVQDIVQNLQKVISEDPSEEIVELLKLIFNLGNCLSIIASSTSYTTMDSIMKQVLEVNSPNIMNLYINKNHELI